MSSQGDTDFARLARFLAGRAIGLVLGGGGARGFAHIGILRALREANISIDMVGGTSMGASIAAQYALGWSPRRMLEENRRVWVKLRPQKDYTLPIVSLLSSRIAVRCARLMYGDTQIEDLWLRFFCVSSSAHPCRSTSCGAVLSRVTTSCSGDRVELTSAATMRTRPWGSSTVGSGGGAGGNGSATVSEIATATTVDQLDDFINGVLLRVSDPAAAPAVGTASALTWSTIRSSSSALPGM